MSRPETLEVTLCVTFAEQYAPLGPHAVYVSQNTGYYEVPVEQYTALGPHAVYSTPDCGKDGGPLEEHAILLQHAVYTLAPPGNIATSTEQGNHAVYVSQNTHDYEVPVEQYTALGPHAVYSAPHNNGYGNAYAMLQTPHALYSVPPERLTTAGQPSPAVSNDNMVKPHLLLVGFGGGGGGGGGGLAESDDAPLPGTAETSLRHTSDNTKIYFPVIEEVKYDNSALMQRLDTPSGDATQPMKVVPAHGVLRPTSEPSFGGLLASLDDVVNANSSKTDFATSGRHAREKAMFSSSLSFRQRSCILIVLLFAFVALAALLGGLAGAHVFGASAGASSVFTGNVSLLGPSALLGVDARPTRVTTHIVGDVDIVGTSLNDTQLADMFSGVTVITGHLRVQSNARVIDLSFLANLAVVSGYIDVLGNAGLRSLSGLARVTTVEGAQRLGSVIVRVANNSALVNVAVPLPRLGCKGQAGIVACDVCTSTDVNRPVGFVAVLSGNTEPICVDDNECVAQTHTCRLGSAECKNNVGSFTCTCNRGYTGSGVVCADIDECAVNVANCAAVGATCRNMPGSFTCACNAGYMGSGVKCVELDECISSPCINGATCIDGVDSSTCKCLSGFVGSTCAIDKDECALETHTCAPTSGVCRNVFGSFTCACIVGFSGDGGWCDDIDECVLGLASCATGTSVCSNTPGSFSCACNAGYSGNGVACDDVNECLVIGACVNGGSCVNTVGSFSCACSAGYSGATCAADINECVAGPCFNKGVCTNIIGSFLCTCTAGYSGMTCAVDNNECTANMHNCASGGGPVCVNNFGSFTCTCMVGYTGAACDSRAGNVVISTAAHIAMFRSALVGVNVLAGNVTIQSSPITEADVSVLFGTVVQINGFLSVINNTALTTLEGLRFVTRIGLFLYIYKNDALTAVEGLRNVTYVGGDLTVQSNANLKTLEGLRSVTSIGDYLAIYTNAALNSIAGLRNLKSIRGAALVANTYIIYITGNGVLTDGLPLSALSCKGTGLVLCAASTPACSAGAVPISNVTTPCPCVAGYSGAGCAVDINECTAGTHNCGSGGGIVCVNTAGSFSCTCAVGYSGAYCGTRAGDVVIRTAGDIATFRGALAAVAVVYGNVTIQLSPITAADITVMFGTVTQISGDVYISENTALTALEGLRNVTNVGGYMFISNNAALTTLEGLRSVAGVGGYLSIYNNAALTTFEGLRSVTSVGGFLFIYNNVLLTTLEGLRNVTSVGGFLRVVYNPALTTLAGLRSVTDVGDYLLITDNDALTTVAGLRSLKSIRGATLYSGNVINIDNNGALTAGLPLSALTCKGSGNVSCTASPVCSAGVVPAVGVTTPCVCAVGYSGVACATDVNECWAKTHSCAGGGALCVNMPGSFSCTCSAGYSGATCATRAGDVSIATAADIVVFRSALVGISMIDGSVIITASPLTSMDVELMFGTVSQINGSLAIQSNPALTSLEGFRTLTNISGLLYIDNNAVLASLEGLRNVRSIGDYVIIRNNDVLTTLEGLRSVTIIRGNLFIYYNSALVTIEGLRNVASVGGEVSVDSNFVLTTLEGLRSLTRIGGDLLVDSNAALMTLEGLRNVTSVPGNLFVGNNGVLTTLEGLRSVTRVDGSLIIRDNAALTTVAGFRNLKVIRGGTPYTGSYVIYINGNNVLTAGLPLSALTCKGSGLVYCANTPACSAGAVPAVGVATPCLCPAGYSGANCTVDVNECTANTHNCAMGGEAVCVNTGGSFTCTCNKSYSGAACAIRTGDVNIRVARDIVMFRTALVGVTVINGNVDIKASPISPADMVAMFGTVTQISGFVYIVSHANLTSMEGLRTLTNVGGYLDIFDNAALTTLEGLRNVTSVGGYLNINSNAALTTLEGLRSLTNVGYYVSVSANAALTTVAGLRNLKAVRGAMLYANMYTIYIENNIALTTGLPLLGLTCKGSGNVFCSTTPACSASVVPAFGVATPCP